MQKFGYEHRGAHRCWRSERNCAKNTYPAGFISSLLSEITPEKKGRDQEQRRINRLLRDPISDCRLSQLSSTVMAEFRDRRVHDGIRAAQIDLILIRHCIKLARLEWGVNMLQTQWRVYVYQTA